ncbi:hypothetical protein WJX84_007355 [Apatococcus fuscideae]|uniref:Peptidase A1 domain-containing protein n=1 Tax=Apatococcus fuscideae TaxID=2026836 RepID=A0AAW1SR80_9CHLO
MLINAVIPRAVYWSDAGVYNLSCDNVARFPTFSVVLDGSYFDVQPLDYTLKVNESETSSGCTSAFVGAIPGQTIILGAPFLRHWFTSYSFDGDKDAAKIGIAKAANASS